MNMRSMACKVKHKDMLHKREPKGLLRWSNLLQAVPAFRPSGQQKLINHAPGKIV